MQREKVGRRADLVERQQLDAQAGGDLARDERIVRHDLHAERARALRHFLADAPEPGDAERLAAQLGAEKLLLLPLAVLHRAIGRRHRARQREHQRAGVLGDADAVGARRVDDQDAAAAGGRHVDVVHAGAGAADDAQARAALEQIGGDLGRAANEQRVGVGQRAARSAATATALGIDAASRLGAEQLQRRFRQLVGDDNLSCDMVGRGTEAARVS